MEVLQLSLPWCHVKGSCQQHSETLRTKKFPCIPTSSKIISKSCLVTPTTSLTLLFPSVWARRTMIPGAGFALFWEHAYGAATLGSSPSSWISSIVSRQPSQYYPRAHKLPSTHHHCIHNPRWCVHNYYNCITYQFSLHSLNQSPYDCTISSISPGIISGFT